MKNKCIILILSMTLFLFGFDTKNDKFEIDYNNNYKIVDNIDNTKTYLVYNNDGLLNNKMDKTNVIKMASDSLEDYFYPTNYYTDERYNNYWYYEKYQYNIDLRKKEILEKAKELNCVNILNIMKDFYYYPYSIWDFHQYDINELKTIQDELALVFENVKKLI